MGELFRKEAIIPISLCDSSGRLGVAQTFSLIMDLATEHASALHLGISNLREKGLFWLAVRTRIRFYRRPGIEERVILSTWPEKPVRLRNNRSYLIEQDGKRLVEGKTEWAILDTKTNKLVEGEKVYPREMTYEESTAVDEPFDRVRDRFSTEEKVAEYTVRSTDIDLGGHMNNAAYPRALFSVFPSESWKDREIRCMDVRFVSPSYEGETLSVYRKDNEDSTEFCMKKSDGTTVLLVCIR